MEIQESKKDLAGLLFAPHEDSKPGDVERLKVCSSSKNWEDNPSKSRELADELIVALQFALNDELSPYNTSVSLGDNKT